MHPSRLPHTACIGGVEQSELTGVGMEKSRTSVKVCEAGVGVDGSDETPTVRWHLRTPAA